MISTASDPKERATHFVFEVHTPEWGWLSWHLDAEAYYKAWEEMRPWLKVKAPVLQIRLYLRQGRETPRIETIALRAWMGQLRWLLSRPVEFCQAVIGLSNRDGVFVAIDRSPWIQVPSLDA